MALRCSFCYYMPCAYLYFYEDGRTFLAVEFFSPFVIVILIVRIAKTSRIPHLFVGYATRMYIIFTFVLFFHGNIDTKVKLTLKQCKDCNDYFRQSSSPAVFFVFLRTGVFFDTTARAMWLLFFILSRFPHFSDKNGCNSLSGSLHQIHNRRNSNDSRTFHKSFLGRISSQVQD